jgi:P4 family phage/plasmid primase-like protien
MTSGIEYLKSKNISWFPVYMDIVDGQKILKSYPDGTMPKYNKDFDNQELIKYRQETYKTNTIWIDTKDIAHLDIDTPEAHEKTKQLQETLPYFNSVRKGLPHYFTFLKNKELHKKRIQLPEFDNGIELLNGQVSYASYDFQVYNADKELKEMNIPLPQQTKPNDDKSFMKTDTIHELLDIIDIEYIDNFNSWIRIGASLYNCGYEMEVFDTFSRRSNKYGGVDKLWRDFDRKELEQLGFGTICYYAKESNPIKWEDIKYKLQTETQKSEMEKFLQSGKPITHATTSKIFHEAYGDKYVYSRGSWFELSDGGIYNLLENDAVTIINKDILTYFDEYLTNYKRTLTDEDKRKSVANAIALIENNSFKKNCVEEAKGVFLDRNLYESLNQNQKLIGFKNGIFDLETCTFRKGEVADKVSMTTGYDYKPEICPEHQTSLEDLFNGYFKNPETAHYFKKHLGSILEGGNKEEKCYFWVGSGRNGKGTTDTMLRKVLGNYYQQLNNNFFTIAEKHTNSPHPEIVDLENSRMTMTHEPEGTTKYLTSKFKNLSGGDPLKARKLQENNHHEFIPTFKPIIQTNHLPNFTDCDFGLLQRLVVINFEYSYVDIVNPSNKNEKKIDINLKDKLVNMNMDFFHFLVKYYKIYKSEGLKEPKDIVCSINDYKKDIDSVKTFMEEAVIATSNDKDRISSADLLYAHNSWSMNKLDKGRFAKRLKCIGFEVKQMKLDGSNKNCVSFVKWNNDFKEEMNNGQPQFLADDNL